MFSTLFTADRLPKKPYCSNDKTASSIRTLAAALSYAYIQPNPPGFLYWLLFDIDRNDAQYRFDDVIAPRPNIIVTNRDNGHAHYYYALTTPVNIGKNGRPWPRHYAEAVYRGLGAILDADPDYVGLIAKNPLFPGHISFSARDEAYELAELDEYITNREAGLVWKPTRARVRVVNEDGRNCTLFDNLRRWSYACVNKYRGNRVTVAGWHEACRTQAEEMNHDFLEHPLGLLTASEIKAIAKSIGNWAWYEYEGRSGNDPEFPVLQATRGRRKGLYKRIELMPLVRTMSSEGSTQRVIAQELGIAQKTVSNWLKRPR